jgi:hypothetical protein
MTHTRIKSPLVALGFFSAVFIQSSGCWGGCECPPVEIDVVPTPFDATLTDYGEVDDARSIVDWSESIWSDISSATLSRDGDDVTLIYTTDSGTFKASLEVSAIE